MNLISILQEWYADDPLVYVSGNNLMYYVPGDKLKHVSPDVFVVKGIEKDKQRDYYLTWEDKAPQLIIEVTSKSTSQEDLEEKFRLYRDTFHVSEYFLFDPYGEYLKPKLQGYRLERGQYVPISPIEDRLPSQVIELHLEASGDSLRLYDPVADAWLPTLQEAAMQARAASDMAEQKSQMAEQKSQMAEQKSQMAERDRQMAERDRQMAERDRQKAEKARQEAEAALKAKESEISRLRKELESLKRGPGKA